jgi:lysophospholipase L1-like esterase
MTGELRRLLQGRFGAAGRGFTQPGKPWKRWRQEGTRAAMSSGWRVHHGMKRDATGPHGISGIRIDADKLGEWVERADEQPFVRVIVHVLRGPNTGRITIYADGKPAATLPTMVEDATLPPHASALTVEVPQGARAVRVELVGDGPVSLLGIATQSAAPGVRYESIGLNGARAYTYLGFDAAIQRADVEAIAPDLIVLGLGTNEAYNLRNKPLTAAVKTDLVRGFAGLIERVRAGAPQADCLILLPMDLVERPRDPSCFVRERVKKGRKRVWVTRLRDDIDPLIEPQCAWTSPESLALTSAASREAATQQQCAIWDQRLAQGGPTALYTWANMRPQLAARDGVHLTLNGYRALARGLFDDLSAAYLRHKRGEDETLDTTPLTPPAPGLPTMEDEPAGPIDDELFGIY